MDCVLHSRLKRNPRAKKTADVEPVELVQGTSRFRGLFQSDQVQTTHRPLKSVSDEFPPVRNYSIFERTQVAMTPHLNEPSLRGLTVVLYCLYDLYLLCRFLDMIQFVVIFGVLMVYLVLSLPYIL